MSKPKQNKRRFGPAETLFYIVYLVGISFSMMYVIARSHLLVTGIAMSAVTIGIAALFYVLRNKKGFSFLAAVLLSILCLWLLSTVPYWSENNFMDFVFTSSTFFNPYFAFVAIMCFGSVIGFTVCYFTAYSPRPCFMMMPMFIPLILSARTAGGVPEWILIIMLAGYAMSAAGLSRIENNADTYVQDKKAAKSRRAAIAVTGAVVAVLLAVIPRSNTTIFGDKLDQVFGDSSGGYYMGSPTLTNFVSNSSVNRGTNNPQGNLLFTLRGDNPQYLDRWAFDIYDGENGWVTDSEYDMGYPGWETAARSRDTAIFVYKLRNAADNGKLQEYAELIDSINYSRADNVPIINETFSPSRMFVISVRDGTSTKVVLHPAKIYDVSTSDRRTVFRTSRGEVFTEFDMEENAQYTVQYFADAPNESLVKALSDVGIFELSTAAYHEGVISSDERDALANEYNFAQKYQKRIADNGVTERIKELAEKITEDAENDYEKAKAIEKWFAGAGFVYDMQFIPQKSEAEYFLFNSKRGICSDFATAATLLARAAGLSARYTEGYLITEEMLADDGSYHVTDAATHAYATVYIEGYGWMNIDPTRFTPEAGGATQKYRIIVTVILAVLLVLAVLVIIFRRRLSELFFAILLKFMSPEKMVRSLFVRTRSLACSINRAEKKSASVGEVCAVIRNALGTTAEAERMRSAFDEAFYGSGEITADPKQLYRDYRMAVRTKRRLKK